MCEFQSNGGLAYTSIPVLFQRILEFFLGGVFWRMGWRGDSWFHGQMLSDLLMSSLINDELSGLYLLTQQFYIDINRDKVSILSTLR